MRRNKIIVGMLLLLIGFILNIDDVNALYQCNIGDGENIRGYGTVTQKYTEATAGQNATIFFNKEGGVAAEKFEKSSWAEQRNFSIYFASPKDGDNIGTIESFNMTFYNKEDEALCELTSNNWGPKAVGQQYAIFDFNIAHGHVSYITASGTYKYKGEIKEFDKKEFHIGKKLGDTGSVSNTPVTETTEEGEITTTTTKRTVKDATPENALTSSGYAKGTKTPDLVGDSQQVSCNSLFGDKTLSGFIDDYWSVAMIIVPVILILLIVIDFVKVIISSDSEAIKKASSTAVKRTVAVVILLMLPVILNIILGWFGIEFCI